MPAKASLASLDAEIDRPMPPPPDDWEGIGEFVKPALCQIGQDNKNTTLTTNGKTKCVLTPCLFGQEYAKSTTLTTNVKELGASSQDFIHFSPCCTTWRASSTSGMDIGHFSPDCTEYAGPKLTKLYTNSKEIADALKISINEPQKSQLDHIKISAPRRPSLLARLLSPCCWATEDEDGLPLVQVSVKDLLDPAELEAFETVKRRAARFAESGRTAKMDRLKVKTLARFAEQENAKKDGGEGPVVARARAALKAATLKLLDRQLKICYLIEVLKKHGFIK